MTQWCFSYKNICGGSKWPCCCLANRVPTADKTLQPLLQSSPYCHSPASNSWERSVNKLFVTKLWQKVNNKSLSKAKPFCGQLKLQLWGHVCEKEEGILWQGLANQPHLPSPLFRWKGKKRRHQKMSQFWNLHSWYLFFIAVRTWMKIMKLEEHLYFPSGFKNVVLYWKTTFSVGQIQ